MSADHDRTFVRTFLGVLGALVGITFLIIIAAVMITGGDGELSDARKERIAERTQPDFQVVTDADNLQQVAASPASGSGGDGGGDSASLEDTYKQVCAACHGTGMAGAPKTGESGPWQARLDDKGRETLYDHAINGFKGMPAKGGNPSLSDDRVKKLVDYMLEESGV